MPNTYSLIKTVSVTSGAGVSSIDFNTIPATVTDVVIWLSSKTDSTANSQDFYIKLNGSSASFRYSNMKGYWNYGPVGASGNSNLAGQTQAWNYETYPYASTTLYISGINDSRHKNLWSYGSMGRITDGCVQQFNGMTWANTSAVTSISLIPNSAGTGVFNQNTVCSLYGITKA
jgi:hypothetical protein